MSASLVSHPVRKRNKLSCAFLHSRESQYTFTAICSGSLCVGTAFQLWTRQSLLPWVLAFTYSPHCKGNSFFFLEKADLFSFMIFDLPFRCLFTFRKMKTSAGNLNCRHFAASLFPWQIDWYQSLARASLQRKFLIFLEKADFFSFMIFDLPFRCLITFVCKMGFGILN